MTNWRYTIFGRNKDAGTGAEIEYSGACVAPDKHTAIEKAFEKELWPLSTVDSPTPEEFKAELDPDGFEFYSDDNVFRIQIQEDTRDELERERDYEAGRY